MGLTTTTSPSILSSDQTVPAGVRDIVARIQAAAKGTDTETVVNLIGSAFEKQGLTLSQIQRALRSPLPTPNDYQVTDPNGNVIANLGFTADASAQNYGLTIQDYFQDVVAWVGLQLELPQTIASTTNASPDVIAVTAHGYGNGDTVDVIGATGDTAINGVRVVENATTNTFTLKDLSGTPINGNGAYAGGGTVTRYAGGGYFQTLGIGGTDFYHSKIRAFQDGTVVISGALIDMVGSSATIVIDPNVGFISVTDTSDTIQTLIGAAGISVQTVTAGIPGDPSSAMSAGTVAVKNAGGALVAYLNITGVNVASPGAYFVNGTTVIDALGNVIGTTYKIGSHTIVDASRNADFVSIKANGVSVIDSAQNAFFNELNINGTLRIASTGDSNFTTVSVGGFVIGLADHTLNATGYRLSGSLGASGTITVVTSVDFTLHTVTTATLTATTGLVTAI